MAPPRSTIGKVCSRQECVFATQFQPLINFYITKTGYPKGECKECTKTLQKKYYVNNQEKVKQNQKLRDKNRKEQISLQKKTYYLTHKSQKRDYHREYIKRRKKEDLGFKIRCSLRTRINMAIQGNQKSGSAVRDLGCSIETLKQRFESMFCANPKTGEMMTWENYGKTNGNFGWDIDHISPLSKFDLTDRKQFLEAVHYTNLQPLWHIPNIIKGNK